MLASLMSFEFNDPESAENWALKHASDHDQIRAAILAQKGVNLENRALYPLDWQNWDSFELHHQDVHNDVNDALGLSGSDLTEANLQDPKSAEEWNFKHFREHQAMRAALKI